MATTRATGPQTPVPVDDEFLQLLYRGGELLAAGKVIEAKDFLERAHQLQPKHEKGQNMLGLTYFKLGLFDRAAELYEMLVRDNPVDPTLRVNLGLVYLKTNALQRAVREFEVAVDLAPDHKKAHNYLGLALAQQGEYGRAREHFLLAGSDAMAEKMSRAIAGEAFNRPEPAQPARERGFSELEGTEVVREQGGVPVAETPPPLPPKPQAHAAEAQPPVAREPELEILEETPTQQAAAEPAAPQPAAEAAEEPRKAVPPPPPAEEDWGAQFGLDDTGHPTDGQAPPEAPLEAQAPAEAPEAYAEGMEAPTPTGRAELDGAEGPVMVVSQPVAPPSSVASAAQDASLSEDITITMDEPPRTSVIDIPTVESAAEANLPVMGVDEVSEDGLPVLTAEPEDPEDLAAIAQHQEALPETPPAPPMEAAPEAYAPENAAPGMAQEFTASGHAEYVPEAPAPAEDAQHHAASELVPASQEGAAPILGELALALSLENTLHGGRFNVGPGGFSAVVDGELLTRLEGLVAFSGQLTFLPEKKRFRGRATDKPFGEGAARMVRASGRGLLFIEPVGRHVFQAVDLGEESAYFRDECVFAFEEPVMFENGRVPSEMAPDLELVHLRGNGKVLLSLTGPLRSVPVRMEGPVTVPLGHLVGWQGNLTPKVVSLVLGPEGEVFKTGVELSGEGFALICLPVR
ncbi:MAG TPA: tetratricopeptide repeat protein [Myxococcaceae bacterium]|nr:tetratricopeptide repeat protein [Myxococcaceae bacterium]